MQHLKIHVLEINILAQVLEQSCIQQNLELVGSWNAAVLLPLLASPKPNVGGDVPRADVPGVIWSDKPICATWFPIIQLLTDVWIYPACVQ